MCCTSQVSHRHLVLNHAQPKSLSCLFHSNLSTVLLLDPFRPILEYTSVLWDSYIVMNCSFIEYAQGRFLNSSAFILKINHLP